MRGLLLGVSIALSAWGPARAAAGEDLTVWWRTYWAPAQGAEVVEHRASAGERACSLLIYHDDDVLLLMWRTGRDPSLFVKHPGWRFRDHRGAARVEIGVGRVASGAGPGGVSTELAATSYRDWVATRLDRAVADLLPGEREVTVDLPDGQASGASFPIERGRMPAVMRGVQDCRAAAGVRN